MAGLAAIKRACCRISRGGRRLGTGYLVGADLVVTCHHVSRGAGEPLACEFVDAGQAPRGARVVAADEAADVAVLALDAPVLGVAPLDFTPARLGQPCLVYGFPAFRTGGVSFSAEAKDLDAGDHTIASPGAAPAGAIARPTVLALVARELLGEQPDAGLGGFSGSPVVWRGLVVGHVLRMLGSDDKPKAANLGTFFAVQAARIAAAVDQVRPPGRGRRLRAALVRTWRTRPTWALAVVAAIAVGGLGAAGWEHSQNTIVKEAVEQRLPRALHIPRSPVQLPPEEIAARTHAVRDLAAFGDRAVAPIVAALTEHARHPVWTAAITAAVDVLGAAARDRPARCHDLLSLLAVDGRQARQSPEVRLGFLQAMKAGRISGCGDRVAALCRYVAQDPLDPPSYRGPLRALALELAGGDVACKGAPP